MEENYCPEGMLDAYLYESFELLEQLEGIVLSEKNESFFDRESVNEIFRILHTLKGSSGIMMYDGITGVTHRLEDIFYYLRESGSEDIPKAELAACIFQASDYISRELNKIKSGKMPDGDPQEIGKKMEACLTALKEEIRERGMELPPENIYVEPDRYYIAPAAEADSPLKIDLGEEPAPGDYVIRSPEPKPENMVGVSMKKLDRLTALVDKLLWLEERAYPQQETGKSDVVKQKTGNLETGKTETGKTNAVKKLRRVSAEIRDIVGEMRQAPIGGVFRRMNRVVFDVSRRLEKNIELKMQGEDVTVDRMFLEQLSAPLMHLVRNAADHGIENAGERLSAGKDARGVILLEARKDKDMLYVSVRDDGRGLDKHRIFEQAKRQRLIGEAADMAEYTDKEIYELITCAGFSTKDEVTELSGRGVGMDVAADKMKEIGGCLCIESVLGKGTEMKMGIPLNEQ